MPAAKTIRKKASSVKKTASKVSASKTAGSKTSTSKKANASKKRATKKASSVKNKTNNALQQVNTNNGSSDLIKVQNELFDDNTVYFVPNTNARYIQKPDTEDEDVVYLADFTYCALKDVVGQLEYPAYSLLKTESRTENIFEYKGVKIELQSGKHGLPTMYDKDVMIYIVSQFMRIKKEGGEPGRYLRLKVNDTLKFCKRSQCGRGYKALMRSLDRLTGTLMKTNIPAGKSKMETRRFHMLDRADSVRHLNGEDSRLDYIEVKISDWLFQAIKDNDVLTLSPAYFDLKPDERRIYELARKHCGTKKTFALKFTTIHAKSGTTTDISRYKYRLKKIAEANNLPDYIMTVAKRPNNTTGKSEDYIVFENRNTMVGVEETVDVEIPALHPNTVEELQKTFRMSTDNIYRAAAEFAQEQAKRKKEIYNFESQFLAYLISIGLKKQPARTRG